MKSLSIGISFELGLANLERCEVTDNFENVRPLTDRRLRISKLDFIFVTRSFTICKLDLYGGSDLIDRF